MTDPVATVKQDAAKAAAVAQTASANVQVARNWLVDFVSDHPKTAVAVILAEAGAILWLVAKAFL